MDTHLEMMTKKLTVEFTTEERAALLAGLTLRAESHDAVQPVEAEMFSANLVGPDHLRNRNAPRARRLNGKLVSVAVGRTDGTLKLFVSPTILKNSQPHEFVRVDRMTGDYNAFPKGGVDLHFDTES